jgi:hypothetical protein
VGGLKKKPSVLYLLGFFGTLTWFRDLGTAVIYRLQDPQSVGRRDPPGSHRLPNYRNVVATLLGIEESAFYETSRVSQRQPQPLILNVGKKC